MSENLIRKQRQERWIELLCSVYLASSSIPDFLQGTMDLCTYPMLEDLRTFDHFDHSSFLSPLGTLSLVFTSCCENCTLYKCNGSLVSQTKQEKNLSPLPLQKKYEVLLQQIEARLFSVLVLLLQLWVKRGQVQSPCQIIFLIWHPLVSHPLAIYGGS